MIRIFKAVQNLIYSAKEAVIRRRHVKNLNKILLCSDCFSDQGLRLDAAALGQRTNKICKQCGSRVGVKLSRKNLQTLTHRFFVMGTFHKGDYGAAPRLQYNDMNDSGIKPAKWFESDLHLLRKTINAHIFHYGPRLWMLGYIEPLQSLQKITERAKIIKRIIIEYPSVELTEDEIFYRMRKSPRQPDLNSEYDSPPEGIGGFGRIDGPTLSVMYASQDIEICIHECRATAEDDLFVATLKPTRNLKLLNLAHLLKEEGVDEFTSLDLSVAMLFLAGAHSYEIIRQLGVEISLSGFDGLIYPSYFSLLRTGGIPFETQYGLSIRWIATDPKFERLANYERGKIIPNLAIFGHPIRDGLVEVKCINRMVLRRVSYEVYYGPVGYG